MQYTWGYIKEAALAKMDIDSNDANAQGFIRRMHVFANEALTQICSAIKPKHDFVHVEVMSVREAWNYCINKYGIYAGIDTPLPTRPIEITPTQQLFWNEYEKIVKVGVPFDMPADFISFNDDMITMTNVYGYTSEAHDDDCHILGDRHVVFLKPGVYDIPYNARWYFFMSTTDNNALLDIPMDICDALPSYIASQLFKIDDEIKAQIYRNEYEMMLSRIDDTWYKRTTTIKVDGGW